MPLYTSVVHITTTVLLKTSKMSQATTHFLSGRSVALSTHHHLAPRLMNRARLYLYSMDPLKRMVKPTDPFPEKCIQMQEINYTDIISIPICIKAIL